MQEVCCLAVQMIGQSAGTALTQSTTEIGPLGSDLTDMRIEQNVRNAPP